MVKHINVIYIIADVEHLPVEPHHSLKWQSVDPLSISLPSGGGIPIASPVVKTVYQYQQF
jgi:hypothetical protein